MYSIIYMHKVNNFKTAYSIKVRNNIMKLRHEILCCYLARQINQNAMINFNREMYN